MIGKLFGKVKCSFSLHEWSSWIRGIRRPDRWYIENRRCARCGAMEQRYNIVTRRWS